MKILNLTMHPATPEQKEAGVFDLEGDDLQRLKKLLTFDELPDIEIIVSRAKKIAEIAGKTDIEYAMIGGAPFLMGQLERALDRIKITPLYSFSKRDSVEENQPDGTVRKTSLFKHVGFILGDVGTC